MTCVESFPEDEGKIIDQLVHCCFTILTDINCYRFVATVDHPKTIKSEMVEEEETEETFDHHHDDGNSSPPPSPPLPTSEDVKE